MAEVQETAAAVELTAKDLERFPARLLKMIGGSENRRGSQQRWILVGTDSTQNAAIMRATVTMAGRMLEQRRRELTERNIETLLDLCLQGEERADIDRDLEQDNAELRARYLREVPTYTATDIHGLLHGSRLRNPKRNRHRAGDAKKRAFAVRVGRNQLFPRFPVRRRLSAARHQGDPETSPGRHDTVADRVLVLVRQWLARREIARRRAR